VSKYEAMELILSEEPELLNGLKGKTSYSFGGA